MENAKTQTKSHAITISPEAWAAINAAAAARWNKLAARANTELQTTTTPPQNGSEYAETPMKSPKPHDVVLDVVSVIETLRDIVHQALVTTNRAVRDCLAAGQALNEARAEFSRGRGLGGAFAEWDDGNGWTEFIEKNLPEISERTAQRWMKAAANVMRVVGDGQWQNSAGQVIDVEATPFSQILATADDELSADSRELKQVWMDFTERKTIKECLAGVFVEGDDSSRSDRAMNGLTARQTSGAERRDYPAFITRKLKEMTEHLVVKGTRNSAPHAREIEADQRAKIMAAFDGAMSVWPQWLLEMLRSASTRELKLGEVERAVRLKAAAQRNFVGMS